MRRYDNTRTHPITRTTIMLTYIATYNNDMDIPIYAYDEEEAAWLAKDISINYDLNLLDIIPTDDD